MLFAVLFCCGIASAQGDVERTTLLKKGMDVPNFPYGCWTVRR